MLLLVLLRLSGKSPTISGRVSSERQLLSIFVSEFKFEYELVDWNAMKEVSYPESDAPLVSDLSSRIVSEASKASQETRR